MRPPRTCATSSRLGHIRPACGLTIASTAVRGMWDTGTAQGGADKPEMRCVAACGSTGIVDSAVVWRAQVAKTSRLTHGPDGGPGSVT